MYLERDHIQENAAHETMCGDRSPGNFIHSPALLNISVFINMDQIGFLIKVLDDLRLKQMNQTLVFWFSFQKKNVMD